MAESKMTLKSLNEKIEAQNETISMLVKSLEEAHSACDDLSVRLDELKPRDRGPKSTRLMTEDDARAIILGDHAKLSHKEAAAKLGLSYSQIYSCRGGYTFKNITEEKLNANK